MFMPQGIIPPDGAETLLHLSVHHSTTKNTYSKTTTEEISEVPGSIPG
jgi:hypothetical protein